MKIRWSLNCPMCHTELEVHTFDRAVEDLAMNIVAADAIAYAAEEPVFDARDLPGRITDEERILIAEALEDSGLFTREAR
ncbi:hypothetical protein [Nocardia tengchongensis]